MIENPPRGTAELSPRLRAIAEHAADRLEPTSEGERSPFSTAATRRVLVILALLVVGVVSHLILVGWKARLATPTHFAVQADAYRAQARALEEQAVKYRALAANGPGAGPSANGVPPPNSPAQLQTMAAGLDRQAALLRRRADIEERKNQGFRIP